VHMVSHQAVGPDLDTLSVTPLPEKLKIIRVITVLKKDILASIAPLGDVVRVPGENYSC